MQATTLNRAGLGLLTLAMLMFIHHAWAQQSTTLDLEAKLIWGTNDETSSDPSHQKLNSNLAGKFKKIFKWNNYFEISRKTARVAETGTTQLSMSPQCRLEITNLGNSRVRVKLFGEGKLMRTEDNHNLMEKDLVIAGDDKNNTAWFVVIRKVESSRTEASQAEKSGQKPTP